MAILPSLNCPLRPSTPEYRSGIPPTPTQPPPGRKTPPLSALAACAGAFTVNWDVVGVDLGGRTLKINALFFGASILLGLADPVALRTAFGATRRERRFIAALSLLLLWLLIRSIIVGGQGLSGFAAVLIPAVVPFVAVLRQRRWAESIVRAFVLGMVFSSLLAVYEFIARQLDLPWMTGYEAFVGTVPRSAALSFEAAYFAAPAVAALIICWAAWPSGRVRSIQMVVLGLGIAAANARIAFVQIAIAAFIFMAVRVRGSLEHRRQFRRRLLVASVSTVGCLIVVTTFQPQFATNLGERLGSIVDSEEVTSNAPRLEAYDQVNEIVADNALFGIGPGTLGIEMEQRGFDGNTKDTGDAAYVANNVWIQAVLDGGAIAIAMQTILVALACFALRDSPDPIAFAVLVGWITIVLGAGLTVSNFWDAEAWVLLSCFFALMSTKTRAQSRSSETPSRVNAGADVTVGSDAIARRRISRSPAGGTVRTNNAPRATPPTGIE